MSRRDPINDDIQAMNDKTHGTVIDSGERDPKMRTRALRSAEKVNPAERVDEAKKFAAKVAKLDEGSLLGTLKHKYKVIREIQDGAFGFTYKVQHLATKNEYALKTEPLTDAESMKRFKTLKTELVLHQAMDKITNPIKRQHFCQLVDFGCTSAFKFMVITLLGENLYTITRIYLNRAFTPSTALRVSIQMLRALMDLHGLGYVHRFLKPHTFAVGLGSDLRIIHMCDFSLAWQFKEESESSVKPPRNRVKMMGAIRYTSRNSHHSRELSRRDDLESWLYLSMEFFYLNMLPWRGDQIPSRVLLKKERFFAGDYPRMFKRASERYKDIMLYLKEMKFEETPDYPFLMQCLTDAKDELQLDFGLPYDWENLPLEISAVTAEYPSHFEHKKRAAKDKMEDTQEPSAVNIDHFKAATDMAGKDVLIDVQMEGTCKNAKERQKAMDSETSEDASRPNMNMVVPSESEASEAVHSHKSETEK
ncbi:hypothetical protein L596_010212 [Steinernema carpocapsae]|uniref:Protein kinase domain-containing protein n=1 Tax=Steinernema carpocapsae TaxID=34508 RepID=A0A4U5PIE6_STECR|nr:hypothetical protein L596_010212 [Steinernema carpocapsae]